MMMGPSGKYFWENPDGSRKAGRQKLRWLDRTKNDLKSMCVSRWNKKLEYRSVWAIIPKEALVTTVRTVYQMKKTKNYTTLQDVWYPYHWP
jgi:hypothetical protein